MNSMIPYARTYAQRGWQSFPIKPRDKTPLVKWTEAATNDEKTAVGWFDNYPEANIGIACGKRSGIVVLDVDAAHGGYESLTELIAQYGNLPETFISKTGNGGEHIFFRHPGIEIHNSAGKLGRGLDIRGDGGYVVAPPSIHPNGNIYEWVVSDTQLADMPQWMIGKLKTILPTPVAPVDGKIIEGGRNDYLTQLAGAMRRKDFGEDAIFSALQIQNRERCNPPLADGEVLQIAKSIIRYDPQDPPEIASPLPSAMTVIEILENDIHQRQLNPKDIWGIPYAWSYLSKVTGGKQKGELIILAGEPGVGKSWWAHQDGLYTAIKETPVMIWSGEMRKKQVYRRFFEMLGVAKRSMLSGRMSNDDWQSFNEAKALIMNSPIYVSDAMLDLCDLRRLLEREIGEHGIEQAIFDYDWLINAPGQGEIEQSQNISRAMKQVAHDLDLSIVLVSSVNKMGMDSASGNVTKSNVSGSGKKLHDADIIFILTKFDGKNNGDMGIMPGDYDRIATLHISKARELDYHVPGGKINYMREIPNPRFVELKKENDVPSWMYRKDVGDD